MGLFNKSKPEIDRLNGIIAEQQRIIASLNSQIPQEQHQVQALSNEIAQLQNTKSQLTFQIQTLQNDISRLNSQVIETNETVLLQSFGLYEPKYDFVNSDQYKARLDDIRAQQKQMVKSGTAASGNMNWTVNGSRPQGNAMVKNMQKLLLRAFNCECEEAISKVKYSNYEASVKRIKTSRDQISSLGKFMSIVITEPYYRLKLQELDLAFEYAQLKQKEKEEQREIKAQMREEAKLQKEIEEARKKVEKEQNHYLNALEQVNRQLSDNPDNADLQAKKNEIESKIADAEKAMKDIDYREANKRAGYVYVISNIGAFGENVYKIGMTRRLDPQERVDELGDASVPFKFDVHAMIFSDDAPALESALHHAFEDRRINKVNQRREFFRVTLDEIKDVVKSNYEKTAEFIETAEAEQYRISQKMQ